MIAATRCPTSPSPEKSATAIGIGWKFPRRTSMTSSARAAVATTGAAARPSARATTAWRKAAGQASETIMLRGEARIFLLLSVRGGCARRESTHVAKIEIDHKVFPILVIRRELGRNA